MRKCLVILTVLASIAFSQMFVTTPTADAVPLSCQEAPNDPDCLFDLLFEMAFSEWNEENGERGINGVGIL